MSEWSLPSLFANLHRKIENELRVAREALSHPGTKGSTSETIWIGLFETYLPKRYRVCSSHIVDSKGVFSDQIDIVIFDRQYSPFVFDFQGAKVVPAESVYAVFEVKQSASSATVKYAQDKMSSVRALYRTSLEIPTASGPAPAAPPKHIIGGLVTLDSDWGVNSIARSISSCSKADITEENRLDLSCVSSSGIFDYDTEKHIYRYSASKFATTLFLLELIARLQAVGTVPMMDVRAYSRWLR